MTHRIFKPIILFHDHSYCSDPSGVIHRIHIPYGDPHYTPLIKKEKQKVESMLKLNGRVWSDYIQSTRSSPHLSPSSSSLSPKPTYYTSPKTPPLKQHHKLKGKFDKTDRQHRTQLLLQQLGPDQHNNNNNNNNSHFISNNKSSLIIHPKELEEEEEDLEEEEDEEDEDCYESDSTSSSSPTPNTIATLHHSHNHNNPKVNHHITPTPNNNLKIKRRRGNLPKSVTAVLKQWLVEHCRNPYPTETEKTGLKNKTGLTLNQISNWFINARRRLLPQILDTVMLQQTKDTDIQPTNINNKKRKRSRILSGHTPSPSHYNPGIRSSDTSMKRRRRYIKRVL